MSKYQRGTFTYDQIIEHRKIFNQLDTQKEGLDLEGMLEFSRQIEYPLKEDIISQLMVMWGKKIKYSQFVNLYHGLKKKVRTMEDILDKFLEECEALDLGGGQVGKDEFMDSVVRLMPTVTDKEIKIIFYDLHQIPGDTLDVHEYLVSRFSLF